MAGGFPGRTIDTPGGGNPSPDGPDITLPGWPFPPPYTLPLPLPTRPPRPPPVDAQPTLPPAAPPPSTELPPSPPLLPEIGPQSPDDPPAGDLGELIRLGDPAEPGVPTLPPGGLWSIIFEDDSALIGTEPWPRRDRERRRWPDTDTYPWSFGPGYGFEERPPLHWPTEFVARAPRRPPIEEVPYRRPPLWPRVPRRTASPWPRNRYGGLDPRQNIPMPLPSERAPYPVMPPGFELPPRIGTPAPAPVPSEPVPAPSIPAPEPTLPRAPAPMEAPPPPVITAPRLPPAPPRPRVARPRIARVLSRVGLGTTAASILRRYVVRRDEAEAVPRFDFRDVVQPPTEAVPLMPQPEVAPPIAQPVSPVATLPAQPDLLPDLTPLNASALPFAQPNRRTEDCRCEDETEEEAEERREANASSVVAEVRTFRRRMSQNSLDNLR